MESEMTVKCGACGDSMLESELTPHVKLQRCRKSLGSTAPETKGETKPSALPWARGDRYSCGMGAVVSGDRHTANTATCHATGDPLQQAENEANADLVVAAVNALHAIAPGREMAAAHALPFVVKSLRTLANALKQSSAVREVIDSLLVQIEGTK